MKTNEEEERKEKREKKKKEEGSLEQQKDRGREEGRLGGLKENQKGY